MTHLSEKIATLWPEIILLTAACMAMLMGLSSRLMIRKATFWVTAGAMLLAAVAVILIQSLADHQSVQAGWLAPSMVAFIKLAIIGVGLLILLVAGAVPANLHQAQDEESQTAMGKLFEPANVISGEFFAFFLFSLTGAMLCAGAADLVWLFLALELTSLPTYVMVAITRDRIDALEAAVKYFFLGAMAAAVFLFGFTLIYGATGSTDFSVISRFVQLHGISPLMITGLVLAILGISFKIAAVPMHFYAADVYQGAAVPVTAFLAFVPKTAGFVSLIALLGLIRLHPDPSACQPLNWLLWIIAALTMTTGNVLGLLQNNVKRVLAYSSIAHSGYMLLGLLALNSQTSQTPHLGNGAAALLFYLVAYGLANLAAFAVLGCVRTRGREAQTFDDIAGLGRRTPALGAIMLVSVLSLIGLPPTIGFIGKVYLLGSAIQHGYTGLVIIAVINSAISVVYYLRIAAACYFEKPNEHTHPVSVLSRRIGAAIAAIAAIALGLAGSRLVDAANDATNPAFVSTSHIAHVQLGSIHPDPTLD